MLYKDSTEYSRLSQVAKAADGARDGRVPPVAVETQRTRSWLVADDDFSIYCIYCLLKQVNYFLLKHVISRKKNIYISIAPVQAQLVHQDYLT